MTQHKVMVCEEAIAIAQAIKYQMRTGKFWDELTPAAKETFDQIATAIAHTVSGDGAHWDGIIAFAQANRCNGLV